MKTFIALALLFSTTSAFAASTVMNDRERGFRRGRTGFRGNERSERVGTIKVGQANYAGTGCPAGTMSVVFAPDNLSFSILFDAFVAESDGTKKRDTMNCTALLPIQIPNGMQMEITRVDFRGFVNLPANGKAVLHSIFNFREGGGEKDRINIRYKFEGAISENYEISSGEMNGRNDTEASSCGGENLLAIKNQMQVLSSSNTETAMATIDSIDGSSNAVYYVNWKKCGKDPRDGRDGRNGRDNRDGRDGRNNDRGRPIDRTPGGDLGDPWGHRR